MRQRSVHEILDEITDRIKQRNLNDMDEPIPHSDSMYRNMMSDLMESSKTLRGYLDTLVQAHALLVIKLTESDPRIGMDGVDGFVVAEPGVIHHVKEISDRNLERIYEGQFHKGASASTVIHELFPKISMYKNTPIGQALNVSVMLQQFLQIIAEVGEEYEQDWKQAKIRELLKEDQPEDIYDNANDTGFEEAEELAGMRAVDSPKYLELETMDLSGAWGHAYKTYGGKFLLRVHFRRNEFDLVKRLIKQKRIATEDDLKFVRDTLRTMETRKDDSPEIQKHIHEIMDCRRTAQYRINQIRMAKEGRL